MNKVLKGLVAVAATAAMAIAGVAGASTAMAEENTTATTNPTITFPTDTKYQDHTYEVYQIFTGDLSDGVLSNVKYGENGAKAKGTEVTAAELKQLTDVNVEGKTDQDKLDVIKTFAKLDSTPITTLTKTSTTYSAAPGYYLIKDKDGSVSGNDANTLYITKVVGDVTISPKSDVPSFQKKVKDTNDTTGNTTDWQDSADYDVNDYVPFQLTGTMPKNIAAYKTYAYTFHDTMSAGLTFAENDNEHPVKVYAVNGTDRTEIKSGYDVLTKGIKQGETFNVKFADLKKAKAANDAEITINENTKIVVEYYGQLNEKSVIGKNGNPNQAYLEYENNPEAEGEGTGKTPEDKVIVFTYEVDINKVNKDNAPLKGATFLLEKKTSNGEWVKVAELEATQNGTSYTSKFQRVDDGTYRLTETKAPAGYTPIAPKEFTISAMHSVESDEPELTKFEITGLTDNKIENTEGTASADIVNTKGSELPSTGGMGTVMLYVAGVAVFVLAGATLVMALRRRNA